MQKYTDIPSSKTLAESLSLILNNDKTALTCQAGTAFPTVDIREGMLCYRIDHKKLYQCAEVLPDTTWRVVADLSGNARLLDGGTGNTINYDKRNLNSWDDMPTGFYQGSNMLNAPTGDTAWRVIQIREGNSSGYSSQLAFGVNNDKIYTRNQRGGMWTDWLEVWTGQKNKVVTGLNADKLDDLEPGNASGQIPINNGTLNVNLNADKLDGYTAGNKSGQIPINNGVVNSGLNADTVDGKHAGNEPNNVPISNGTINKGLNAEMVGGVKVDNLLQVDGSGNIPRKLTQVSIGTANVDNFGHHNYSGSVPTNRDLGGSDKYGVDGATSEGGGDYSTTTYWSQIESPIGRGDYNLYNILQRLINVAHVHKVYKHTKHYNCRCNCRCDCDCSDDNCQ